MSAATATRTDFDIDLEYRHSVLAGMQSDTFKNLFHGEFNNLRQAIFQCDREEIKATIEALEACAVDACEQFDNAYKRAEIAEAKLNGSRPHEN